MARNFDFLHRSKGALAFPFSWSTVQIYYNPRSSDPADLVGRHHRPEVPRPDRGGEHPDRPHGHRRHRHRIEAPVQLTGDGSARRATI